MMATTYYVDGFGGEGSGGSDSNDGRSLTSAFATIQRAANFAAAGDTIEIRGGVYRETVNVLRSGTEGAPITFRPYQDEEVILSSADQVTGWTPANIDIDGDGNTDADIWRATVTWEIG